METPQLILRAVEPSDTLLMYEWENDRRHWYVSGTLAPMPLFIIEMFTQSGQDDIKVTRQLRLIIGLGATRQTIGYLDLFDIDLLNRRAGVGILIGDDANRNKGFGTVALQHLKTYVKETLNLHQLFCNIHRTNKASLHLFSKAGFVQCGVLKNWSLRNGAYDDVVIMQCFL